MSDELKAKMQARVARAGDRTFEQLRRQAAQLDAAEAHEVEWLPVNQIRRDGGTQPRAKLDKALMAEYAEDMKAEVQFPPVDVFYDGQDYWLADGFHRIGGAELASLDEFPAVVHQGTQRDAVLFSVGVNAGHGRRRTNEDKRRAVLKMLQDTEWGRWSDREIARHCRVHHEMVGTLRKSLNQAVNGDKQPSYRPADSANESELVTYASRTGRVTVMDTSQIRRANTKRTKSESPAPSESPIPPTPVSPGGIIRDTVVNLLREHGSLAASELRERLENRLGKRLDAGLFFGAINGLCATGVIMPRQPGMFALPEGTEDQPPAGDDAYQDGIPPIQLEDIPASDDPVGNYDTPIMRIGIMNAAIAHLQSDAASLRRIGEHQAAEDWEDFAAFWIEQWGPSE